jgi:nucleoside phosphorylase
MPMGDTGALLRDEDKYKNRFDYFSEFYKEITGNFYPTNYEDQAILHTFTENKFLVLSLNSAWHIDHYHTKRASINQLALGKTLTTINSSPLFKDYLKIALWHHPVTGLEMMSSDFLEQLATAKFEVCLHGHIHKSIRDFYTYDTTRGLHIVGGGTFGAPAKEQVTSIPLQYNLLILDPNKASITLKSRKKETVDGAWSADPRWGDKEDPKAHYSIDLKHSFQLNKEQPIGKEEIKNMSTKSNHSTNVTIDIAIITAIEVERKAVCEVFNLTDKDREFKDTRVYWRGRLQLADNCFYEIVVAQCSDMANIDAALITSDILHHWSPQALLMVGIAASAKDQVKLGDVVAGKEIYYYERGKETPEGKSLEPKIILADSLLWNRVSALPEWQPKLGIAKPDNSENLPKLHLEVIASGEKVIANEEIRNHIVKQNRKIAAIEMEGYGFSRATWSSISQPRWLVIRGISDDGSKNKDDKWHHFAAMAAANFAKHFLLDKPLNTLNTLSENNQNPQ